jgi:hypothetical protein
MVRLPAPLRVPPERVSLLVFEPWVVLVSSSVPAETVRCSVLSRLAMEVVPVEKVIPSVSATSGMQT